jgi:eukaryotic-like serine/threonine-protein kinase
MGAQPDLDRRCVRFGVFELNTVTGELRKHGIRVRLQEQPLKLLMCLLEVPGEIRSREDLIGRIWPEGTFVDYDRGLNAAVTRLRQALADSADAPRYVETVGRKGYRFIAPVEPVRSPGIPEVVTVEANGPPLARSETAPPAPERWSKRLRLSQVWFHFVIFMIGVAVGGLIFLWRNATSASKPLVRLSIELGPGTLGGSPGTALALSPDGRLLAVVLRGEDGKVRLAIRRLDQDQLIPLAGTDGAASPFFSPDGQWIAFFADDKLKKIALQGGAPITLAEAATYPGPMTRFPAGSWGDDGNIIAMLNSSAGLARVPATGGSPQVVTRLNRAEGEVDSWPQVLPGSQAVLFTRHTGDSDNASIEVFSFQTGVRKTILKNGFLARYLPSGYLVYIRENTLFAARFDLSRLALTGVPQPVLEDIGNRPESWSFDFSTTGSFVFSTPGRPRRSVFRVDRAGRATQLPTPAADSYTGPRFSPDGKRLAFSIRVQGRQDIWVHDIVRGVSMRITTLSGLNDTPIWTADGRNIIFRSVEQPNPGIYAVAADGSEEPKRLADLGAGEFPYSVSPDGRRLAIWDRRAGGAIWTVPIESAGRTVSLGKAEPFLQARFNPAVPGRLAPAFSPSSRWLAYCSNESGQLEVYVAAFPGPGGRTRVSSRGGKFPVWSRNTKALFFLDLESNRIMASRYEEKSEAFIAGKPEVWSDKRLLDLGRPQSYDMAPDGEGFVAVLDANGSSDRKPVNSLTFLLNFFDELHRRVRTQGK